MSPGDISMECNEQLDFVIERRRTVRSFTDQVPPKDQIEQIVKAGLLAPYASAAVGPDKLFRRFWIFERGGKGMETLKEIALSRLKANVEALKKRCEDEPSVAEKAGPFVKRLEAMAAAGQVPLADAPYFIVIGEKSGVPAVEMQSLAHVLENMWLKATALGLGFRLISMTEQMGRDEGFRELLGVAEGEFGFDGCTIGYATEWPPPTARPSMDEAVTWMK